MKLQEMNGPIEVFMARQPIYDARKHLAAYELLYRTSTRNEAGNIAPEDSARSLVSTLADIGVTHLVGNMPAFINIDTEILLSGAVRLLPSHKVILEILETVEATPDAVDAVRDLRAEGFVFALDDFSTRSISADFAPHVDIIKLDVLALSNQLARQLSTLRRPGMKFVAEKIETRSQYEQCKLLDFDLYQGYYFSRPEIIRGRSIPANKLSALQIVARLQDPSLTISALEDLIVADLSLSHRLLKMVRSAQMGMPDKVNSLRQAVMFLGMQTIATLATLIALATSSDKPSELFATALVRAKMCELITKHLKKPDPEKAFTIGLFSVIDAVLDAPMEELLAQLPLDDEINSALIEPNGPGHFAEALRSVCAFEAGNWPNIDSELPIPLLNACYLQAVRWANSKMEAFHLSAAA